MPRLVEDAGGELAAGYLRKLSRHHGVNGGETHLGGRAVRWERTGEGVTVSHRAPGPGAAVVTYTTRTVVTVLPSGGHRHWWSCPSCARRCDALYLPAGRERLGCRRCCGLSYRSQQVAGPVAVRKERPGLWAERTYSRWEWDRDALRMRLVVRRQTRRRL